MKRGADNRAWLCFVLILVMGILPGSVLAEENDNSGSDVAINTANVEAVVESREMLPGDFATDDGSQEQNIESNSLKTASVFTSRLSAPSTDNDYYYEKNIFYQSGYGMPNCTAYAWGRAYEILGSKPSLSNGNANQFWDYNLSRNIYSYGSTPKLGAIVCWDGSSCGHVAVVEAISGNTVTISESAWSGALFYTTTYTIGSEDEISVGGFQGYIYIGEFSEDTGDTTPPAISNPQITDIDDEGFTVSCQVSDVGSGINRVMFPTWTDEGGQNDLIWYTGTVNGNTATYRVLYSDHNNERGTYTIHIYAYDQFGNAACTGLGAVVEKKIGCSYQTHIQDIGWQGWKQAGEISGTYGLSKRLEAIEIQVDNKGYDLGIAYQTHVENIGWQDYWADNGNISGTSGASLRLEAINIKLTGKDAGRFDIYYRVHTQNIGWQDWAKNGASSGTTGFAYRLEAIEIQIVPAGSPAPGATINAFTSNGV
ncbi:GBS Bsp-like repeat-containing protein [Acetobacterium bakii]|uniref:GBS Bsp-like repeat-containing protein n=1 Tax=Acetobacterium bakii TaxID=52689 RepID=UPI000682907D|nr:GBS Bsp-like repeat-containing protein [Acetobacterium bakii]